MGVPVYSIKGFEDDIKHRYRKDFALVILANAHSDSRAVEFVKRNFHVMDRLSADVNFYLPGYNVLKDGYGKRYCRESWYRKEEEVEFSDSHLWFTHYKDIYSPRLGPILFNEAEFADFVMEFTSKIPGFFYVGGCMMILLPITPDRKPNYAASKVFELDKIVECPGVLSLDSFLHHTFNEIRENHSDGSFVNRLLGRSNGVIKRVEELYREATFVRYHEDRYEIVVQNVIMDMERCLRWSLRDEFFFISYSSRNVMLAEMLKHSMQDKKLNVWIAPDGIPLGRDYSMAVPIALRFARSFVLILTKDSANSRWVKRELDVALNNDNTKVRVLFADGYTIDDMRRNDQLNFYLNVVQIKFQYEDVINNEEAFIRFISE